MKEYVSDFLYLQNYIYVGDFTRSNHKKNMVAFEWKIDTPTKKDSRGRIYIFVETDSIGIKKINKVGKSNDKSGLIGTISSYTSTLSGSPSITRFSLHHLIRKKIDEGKKISVFVKFIGSVKAIVEGITTQKEVLVPLDVTYFEKQILDDYKKLFGCFPEWNFQESGKQVSIDLIDKFTTFIKNKRVK